MTEDSLSLIHHLKACRLAVLEPSAEAGEDGLMIPSSALPEPECWFGFAEHQLTEMLGDRMDGRGSVEEGP